MRYFVQFSYVGTRYHGWQKQPNAITIQSVMEDAFSKLLGRPVTLTGAGRTDTGVHARQLFAHFDVDTIEDQGRLVYRLNAFLPKDIAVQKIFKVPHDAHARFDATERTYEYWVVQKKNPFLSEAAHYVKYPLDIGKMNQAAAILRTYSDFECFSKSNTDVKTYRCDLRSAFWNVESETLVFTITADRFLRNMVRAIVGTLLEVGLGKMVPEELREVIVGKDRSAAGASAPAKGLYLTRVLYPEKILKIDG
ncbi:tRNA pseudouridine(38-40) synthase TruA [Flavobacteriaceae bacterium TP-CH-4]|uniref:tRNA pseudouridine synthase A n=1 Tax=Pelagihabitans pacificus TaxID=2696054 RepID=A0A967AWL3_9FLAO|nr:tRNA pseudouridine(38-40) synthase TruA [Pelagihabitans pacificus]NHF57956.1 tRNA pseudouridine(38-40) synthase TruA [Pelagihabitans pacificus]